MLSSMEANVVLETFCCDTCTGTVCIYPFSEFHIFFTTQGVLLLIFHFPSRPLLQRKIDEEPICVCDKTDKGEPSTEIGG